MNLLLFLWFLRVISLVMLGAPVANVNLWWKLGAAIVLASSWDDGRAK